MWRKLFIIKAFLLVLLFSCSLCGQTGAGTFEQDGLKFKYPADWNLTDRSNSEKQLLLLSKTGLTVMIVIDSPRIPMAQRGFSSVQSRTNTLYIANIENILDMSQHPSTRELVCMDFNGADIPGIRYSGSQKNEPTKGETYTFTVGGKSLSLLYIRTEKDSAEGDKVWQELIKSLLLNDSNKINEVGFYNTGGGALNDKALKLVRPIYPQPIPSISTPNGGTVQVEVSIDETGKVVSAEAVSGPKYFYDVSERAAKKSRFPPLVVCGKAKSFSGIIEYNFAPIRK